MNTDSKLDMIDFREKLRQFSIIQLRLLRDMAEEVRDKYDTEMFIGRFDGMRRHTLYDWLDQRIKAMEVEIDFQDKNEYDHI